MEIFIITIYFWKNVPLNDINLIYYDRIDVSEGINVNKRNLPEECDICHYWHF